ncbi:MAG TPA: DUF5107 domain-containing protein [Candidatus Hydrogenedentes bacterium]|nr:DUF5107 domain-containing protein [Candidatus Hydrogenedentota bacterium]HRT18777.1 DUF5107 domain-containing protein [Candidatus Hydrogenedentota bacterium]HRT65777.1 DUF5107 domain-containing protein [Candidatus Hydrogenedentota bacterium]
MTTLRIEPYEIPAAAIGPENPLPCFRGADEDSHFSLDDALTEEDRRFIGWRTAFRVLPHRMQDGYTREKTPRTFDSIVLENDVLRATFLPQLGGRLVSLFHKRENRELLDRNPVFQPANLALRNAWFSGGIEWNTTLVGHYYLTCSPVYAARVEGLDGAPVLRLYEWDRVKCFPWQIDFHLPQESPCLYARVRLLNPHDHELAMYWWTNMAVPERPGGRVIFPADTAITPCEDGKFGIVRLPSVRGEDATYAARVPFAQEMFSRIPDGQRRWVAHIDEDGSGFFETSTDRLRGRKFFCWGMNPGGRRWQAFLSRPGQAYLEIQAGLARTQLECLPMPAHAEWTWLEAFGTIRTDPGPVHGADYPAAWKAVDTVIEQMLPRASVNAFYEATESVAHRPPTAILHHGSGWGALERKRLAGQGMADPIPTEWFFPEEDLQSEQEPWMDLLEKGALPETPPESDPGAYMVQPEWRTLLEKAVEAGRGNHWLAWYHLGVMRMEDGDIAGAEEAWTRSLSRAPSGWAYRNLAVVHERRDNAHGQREMLNRAWETGPRVAAIAIEYAHVLLRAKDYEALAVLMETAPPEIRTHERMRLVAAQAALDCGDLDAVAPVFDYDFATVREGEVTLTDLWFQYHEKRIALLEGIPVDDALRRRIKRECPPPWRIDFRMIRDVD